MAVKLCKEQQISFGNNTKYSDFIDGKEKECEMRGILMASLDGDVQEQM